MPDQMTPPTTGASAGTPSLDVLQDLVIVLRDSEEGYKRSADDTGEPQLKATFHELARARGQQAEELERLIQRHGGTVRSRSSMMGAAHRLFVDLKSALSRNDRLSVLEEVVRGEAYAEGALDKALREPMPADARPIAQRVHDSLKQSRDRFRRMADAEGARFSAKDTTWSMSEGIGRGLTGRGISFEAMQGYLTDRPMVTALVALGVGFVLGALLSTPMRGAAASLRDYGQRYYRGGGDEERYGSAYGGGHGSERRTGMDETRSTHH